ncbi:MAG: penicillin-binding protein 2 [Candidatus Omnitrophica bacterium]|nr:penicillin-binding protein 2 [Candidatus Omnitrophota bacterium]
MEKPKQLPDEIFSVRIKGLKILFFILLSIIFGKLLYLQGFKYSYYHSKANQLHFIKIEMPAHRGTIYGRNNNILAIDIPAKTLYVYTKNVKDKQSTIKTISEILNIPENKLEEKFREIYPLIERNIPMNEYDALKSKNLQGLNWENSYQRFYPKGKFASSVIGTVNIDGGGLEGVEYSYNNVLAGKKGKYELLITGRHRHLPGFDRIISRPEKGAAVYLTIDSNIQGIVEDGIKKCFKEFNPSHVSVVVMNPKTGAILALANRPDYNPNTPWDYSLHDRKDFAVQDVFEPGSMFKIVTASAVFQKKKATPGERIFCHNGVWLVRGHLLHDAEPMGTLTVTQVIAQSSNIGTVQLAMRLGRDTLYRYIKKFGFGDLTGIDLPGEASGILKPLTQWTPFTITTVPYGQEVGVTCIQMIRAMAVLANGGYLVQPHVVRKIVLPDGKTEKIKPQNTGPVISSGTVSVVDNILNHVVSNNGTGSFAQIPGYRICGKTGTSQIYENGHYSNSHFVASFIGFLPLPDPKVVILVNVYDPKGGVYYGGSVAAPVWRDIAWRIMQYYNIPPKNINNQIALSYNKP